MFGEADFDIVTTDTLDLALKEAEVIKVLDEIVIAFPALRSSPMCFQLGHSDLLQLIFDFCGVEQSSRRAVAEAGLRSPVAPFRRGQDEQIARKRDLCRRAYRGFRR